MTHSAPHPAVFLRPPLRWRFSLFIALSALAVMLAPATAAPPPTPNGAGTPNLLIFELHLDRAILADALIVYESGNDLLLPLGELTRLLSLGITIDPGARVASGFVLSEERVFRLDLATRTVTLSSGRESFDPDQVRWLDDDIYVASRLLQGWLPVNLYIDLSTLVMDVAPREKLPLQYRLERERSASVLGRRAGVYLDPGYPRAAPDYKLLSLPFIDQTLNLDYQWNQTSTTNNWAYSAFLTGDLLWMEGSLFLATNQGNDPPDPRLTLSRNDPDGALLGPLHARSLTLGSMGVPALNNVLRGSGSGNGLLLSNRPLTLPASYGLHTLRGDLPPGWDVTLYFNDALIAFQPSRLDGLYEFADRPLVFGVNEFRLIFNGPLGQTRVERQLFILDQTLTKPGEFVYTVAGQQDDNGRRRTSSQFDFGLAKRLAFSGGMVSTPLPGEGEERRFYNLGLRTALSGLLLNGDYVRAEEGEALYELGVKTRLGRYALDLTHTGLSKNFVSDFFPATTDQVKLRDRARVSGTLPLGKRHLPVALDFSREEAQSGILTLDLQGRISLNLLGTSFTNALSWNQRGESTSTVGTLQLRRRVAGIGLNSQVAYLLAPQGKITTLALNGDKNFGQASRWSLGVQHALDPDETTLSAGVTHNFGTFGLGLNGRYVDTGEFAAGLQLFMALGREPRSGAWMADWQPLAGAGAVSARTFLDTNQNNVFDPGEEPIEGAGFTINAGSRHPARSNADGLAYLTRLPPRQYADLALDTSTLEDPQWLPTVKGVRILPRPGKVQSLDFPVVLTGEVDGTVSLREEGQTRGIGNALVELVDDRGMVMASGLSAADGYYVIPAVRPGHYKAMISSAQLDKLGLASTAPVELTMRTDGEFIYGLNFTLQKSKPLAVTAGSGQAATVEEFVVESLTFCQLGADCNAMQAKLRRDGYESTLNPVSTLHLKRLRLGPFTGKKLKQVLAFARTIEPGSYSVRVDGSSYVIHAGAYLIQGYIDRQVNLFAGKGIKVQLEPVEIASTLHRVRFGSFATQADAGAAAHAVTARGMQVEVVRVR